MQPRERASSRFVDDLGRGPALPQAYGETVLAFCPKSRTALEYLDMVKGGEGSDGAPGNKGTKMRTEAHGMREDGAQIDPRIQNEIGKHLRAIYDDVINEPVPSKFMDLLEQLERSTRKG